MEILHLFNSIPLSRIYLYTDKLRDLTKSTENNATFMFRFVSSELLINQWNSVLNILTEAGHYYHLFEIQPVIQNGVKYYRFRNYVHSSDQYAEIPGFEEGADNVVVIKFMGANTYLYINGTLVSTHGRSNI